MPRGALAVVESWLAAVNRRDGASLEALSAASIEIVGPRGEGRLDRGVLSQWLLRSGLSATPRRWFCGGDGRVVVAHDVRWDHVETGETQSTASIASEFVVADGVVDRYVRHDDGLDAALAGCGLAATDEVIHGARRTTARPARSGCAPDGSAPHDVRSARDLREPPPGFRRAR